MSVSRPVAVLDANVLYPARLRDLLIRLALGGCFDARWSERILDECFTNLRDNRPDLSDERLDRTRRLMKIAVPDALVAEQAELVSELDLPDVDDRHVLATAISAGAEVIVTANLADFPAGVLARYDVEALSADAFVHRLWTKAPMLVSLLVEQQAAELQRPSMSTAELLDGLEAVGLTLAVHALRSALPPSEP